MATSSSSLVAAAAGALCRRLGGVGCGATRPTASGTPQFVAAAASAVSAAHTPSRGSHRNNSLSARRVVSAETTAAAAQSRRPTSSPSSSSSRRREGCCSSGGGSGGCERGGVGGPWSAFAMQQQRRTYLHFTRTLPEDYELPMDTMPSDVDTLMKSDPKKLGFFENYWYWRIRGESTMLNPEELPKKSYKQLARDMGMQVVTPETEHMVGLLELYEYLKSSPFVGPFGTIENPVIVPSVHTDRVVGCTGGTGDNEHVPLWFRCREGFLYRCGECDQIFMLVRVLYSLPDGKDPFPVDPELDDVFDKKLLENGQKMWNSGDYVHWPVGNLSYKQMFLEGKWGNEAPQQLPSSMRRLSG